jgi:hypothetical protein
LSGLTKEFTEAELLKREKEIEQRIEKAKQTREEFDEARYELVNDKGFRDEFQKEKKMLSLLFAICMIWFVGKFFVFGLRASWGIMKLILICVFHFFCSFSDKYSDVFFIPSLLLNARFFSIFSIIRINRILCAASI